MTIELIPTSEETGHSHAVSAGITKISHYTFNLDGSRTGILRVKDGQLTFEGDADASAKQFFDAVIQAYSDTFTAGFEACRDMAYRAVGECPCEVGETKHYWKMQDAIRALQPQQKDSSAEKDLNADPVAAYEANLAFSLPRPHTPEEMGALDDAIYELFDHDDPLVGIGNPNKIGVMVGWKGKPSAVAGIIERIEAVLPEGSALISMTMEKDSSDE